MQLKFPGEVTAEIAKDPEGLIVGKGTMTPIPGSVTVDNFSPPKNHKKRVPFENLK